MMNAEERKRYRNQFLLGLAGAFVGGILFFLPFGRTLKIIGAILLIFGGVIAALILIGTGIYLLFGSEKDE